MRKSSYRQEQKGVKNPEYTLQILRRETQKTAKKNGDDASTHHLQVNPYMNFNMKYKHTHVTPTLR